MDKFNFCAVTSSARNAQNFWSGPRWLLHFGELMDYSCTSLPMINNQENGCVWDHMINFLNIIIASYFLNGWRWASEIWHADEHHPRKRHGKVMRLNFETLETRPVSWTDEDRNLRFGTFINHDELLSYAWWITAETCMVCVIGFSKFSQLLLFHEWMNGTQ